MRKYLIKFFSVCNIFFSFFNKYAKNIMKLFASYRNFCKIFHYVCKNCDDFFIMCAKIVVKFLQDVKIGSIFLPSFQQNFVKTFTNCIISLICIKVFQQI